MKIFQTKTQHLENFRAQQKRLQIFRFEQKVIDKNEFFSEFHNISLQFNQIYHHAEKYEDLKKCHEIFSEIFLSIFMLETRSTS